MAIFIYVELSLLLLTAIDIMINAKTIQCKGKSCSDEVWCTDNQDCAITCYDCVDTTIHCPTTAHQCNVTCVTQHSCQNTVIDAISSDSIAISSDANFALSNGTVKCPLNGDCNIHCESDNACQNVVIDGRASSHTNISVTAIGTRAFYNSKVYASSYGTLDMYCNGDESCAGTDPIQSATNTLELKIVGRGSYVLEESNIYCPNNGCNIDIKGSYGMQGSNIYATGSFHDINFLCDDTFDEGCTGITMFCGDGYSSSCSMLMLHEWEWQCIQSYTNTTVAFTSVELTIQFDYILSPNYQHITLDILHRICANISLDLLNADINRIADSCVEAIEYDIDIDEKEGKVIVDAIIYVCNTETLSVLIHLSDIIIEEAILIDKESVFESTVSYTVQMEHNDVFNIIVAIFGILIFVGVLIVAILCFVNARKDIQRNKDNMGNARRYAYRISTLSKTSITDQDDKKEEYVDDPIEEAEPLALASQTDANKDEDERYSMDGMSIDIAQIALKYDVDAVTPYDPGSPKHMDVDKDKSSVKQWLKYNVGLPEYYLHFMDKGYVSLDVIKEINDRDQLEDVGVFAEQDIMQLLKEINKLKHVHHDEMHSEGMPIGVDDGDGIVIEGYETKC